MVDCQLRDPNYELILMDDGASYHKAKTVTRFLNASDITVLSLPDNSPNMNPIENCWSIVKKKRERKR